MVLFLWSKCTRIIHTTNLPLSILLLIKVQALKVYLDYFEKQSNHLNASKFSPEKYQLSIKLYYGCLKAFAIYPIACISESDKDVSEKLTSEAAPKKVGLPVYPKKCTSWFPVKYFVIKSRVGFIKNKQF